MKKPISQYGIISEPIIKRETSPLAQDFNRLTAGKNRSGRMESKSTRTFTETTGSGANKITKTVVEETIIKADGSKVTNRKETVTHGEQGGATASGPLMIERGREKEKDSKKEKGGGVSGVGILISINCYYYMETTGILCFIHLYISSTCP